jgi:hypothetical protein
MANALYGLGKKKILDGDIDMLVHTIKAALVSNEYAENLATHEFFTDLTFAKTISKVAVTSNVVTITTTAAHGLVVGMTGTVAATTNTAVNGAFTVTTVSPTTNSFTYAKTTTNIVEAIDTGTVTAAAALTTPETMANPTTTLGVYDADDVVFADVPAGGSAGYVVLYRDTGSAATSPLIACFDTITNFPATTNGGDITVAWSNIATTKIFAL